MAELERQASLSESPGSKPAAATENTRRSITSSALTSLLPIATASGIVQPNYNTPKISFYSPSGRLIQSEGSSSPETSALQYRGSPTVKTSNYNRTNRLTAQNTLTATACLPPARPTLLPMTTPPISSAPLPVHLRHHHNYRHPERSQIESCESLLEQTPAVKGCGGIVRTSSFTLRSGTRHSPHKNNKPSPQHKRHRSTKSIVHELKGDVSFYKSRYIALAAQSCGPTPKSKKTCKKLHKRHTVTNEKTAKRNASKPQDLYKHAATSGQSSQTTQHVDNSILGPLAGHALRICFCQPYDGAGKPTHADASCTTQHSDTTQDTVRREADQHAVAARPISSSRHAPRKTTRRCNTSRSTRPDSGVSVRASSKAGG